MSFKGKPIDAKAVGKDLGVRYVLEGSMQPSGDIWTRRYWRAHTIRRSTIGMPARRGPISG
jgi:hypothetical protein